MRSTFRSNWSWCQVAHKTWWPDKGEHHPASGCGSLLLKCARWNKQSITLSQIFSCVQDDNPVDVLKTPRHQEREYSVVSWDDLFLSKPHGIRWFFLGKKMFPRLLRIPSRWTTTAGTREKTSLILCHLNRLMGSVQETAWSLAALQIVELFHSIML